MHPCSAPGLGGGCPPKRNGRRPPAGLTSASTPGGTATSALIKPIFATSTAQRTGLTRPRMTVMPPSRRWRASRIGPAPTASWTWRVPSMSGSGIGWQMIITGSHRMPTPRGHQRGNLRSKKAAPGTAAGPTCGHFPAVTMKRSTTRTTWKASAA